MNLLKAGDTASAKVRCVAFDFDGTLVRSNAIKRQCFYNVVAQTPLAAARLDEILAEPEPGDRHAVFAKLRQRLSDGSSDLPRVDEWAADYARLTEDAIAVAPEIAGATAAMTRLRSEGIACYLNSATPRDALLAIIAKRGWTGLFSDTLGAPNTKVENLKNIRGRERVIVDEMVMVGDSDADYEAAESLGCWFVGIGNEGRFTRSPALWLPDLSNLPDLVQQIGVRSCARAEGR